MPVPPTTPPPTATSTPPAAPVAPPPAILAEVPATPPPAAPPEVKPAERKEQLGEISDKLRNVLKDRLKGKATDYKPDEKPTEKPPEKKPESKEVTPPETPPEPPAKPDEKPPEKPTDKKPVTARKQKSEGEAIAEATRAATEAARAATELARSRETVEKPPTDPAKADREKLLRQLPESFRADVPVLEAMEKRHPDKYNGLTRRYIEAAIRTQNYQEQWEKAHPDGVYDPKDTEHDSFFARNEVNWDERDYGRTLARMEMEPEMEKERESTRKFQEEMQRKEDLREAEPMIRRRQAEESRELIRAIDPEAIALVDDTGRPVQAEFEKLDQKDPIAADILARTAYDMADIVDVVERVFHPKGLFEFDEKNQAHVLLAQYTLAKEDQIVQLSADDRRDGKGRMFATRRDYAAMTAAQRDRHWQLEGRDIISLRRQEMVEIAKTALTEGRKRMETIAQRLGFVKAAAPEVAVTPPEKPPEKPVVEPPKPTSPPGGGEPKVDTLGNDTTVKTTDYREVLKQRIRGNTVV